MTYVPLTPIDLLLAAALLVVNAAISWFFRLGLERSLAIAAVRMVVQLALVGLVLKLIFAQTSPLWAVLMGLVMVLAAGFEVVSRQHRRIRGWHVFGLSTATLLFVGLVITGLGVGVMIGPDPWYAPRYILPILGMVLGNTMTAISLVLDTLTETAHRERGAIEARLALGAHRFEAMRGVLSAALRTGMMPILNSMATTGIVALPGMMTGQILAGVDPIGAAKYQVLIMFLIASATALGAFFGALGGVLLLTDKRHRLRLDALRAPAQRTQVPSSA
jgi:putative ABC transport system permease protein